MYTILMQCGVDPINFHIMRGKTTKVTSTIAPSSHPSPSRQHQRAVPPSSTEQHHCNQRGTHDRAFISSFTTSAIAGPLSCTVLLTGSTEITWCCAPATSAICLIGRCSIRITSAVLNEPFSASARSRGAYSGAASNNASNVRASLSCHSPPTPSLARCSS